MSRSLGDSCLDDIGVQPVPEVTLRALKPKDRFMVIASDGVWQGIHCVEEDTCHRIVTASDSVWQAEMSLCGLPSFSYQASVSLSLPRPPAVFE